jgi:hypothetical protein
MPSHNAAPGRGGASTVTTADNMKVTKAGHYDRCDQPSGVGRGRS